MAQELESITYNEATLTSNDGKRAEDISQYISSFDYFEDILSSTVTARAHIVNTTGLYNRLPIRSGERFDVEIANVKGLFSRNKKKPLYVTSVSNYMSKENTENFYLHFRSLEAISNETSRCVKKYEKASISEHVEDILKNILETDRIGTIERTVNSYGFYGNQKKPFHVLKWLGPKGIPAAKKPSGTSGDGETGEAKGTSGYFFFENADGFNFRSIESMVSKTTQPIGGQEKSIQTFIYSSEISGEVKASLSNKIIQHVLEKNTELLGSLRIGLYGNRTFFFNPYNLSLDRYDYTLDNELGNKLGSDNSNGLPEFFTQTPSRIFVRSSDRGMFSDSITEDSGRDNADMAKSYARYNLLFSQSLNINVPLNASLKAGDIVKVILPDSGSPSNNRVEVDEQMSGYYLIKNLRHHFEKGRATTSISLIRDSYGL